MKCAASAVWKGDPTSDVSETGAESVPPIFASLIRTAPFDVLNHDQLHALIDDGPILRFSRGEVVTRGHALAEHVWVVLDGEVKCSLLSATGAEKIMQIASAGTMFGEEAALLRRPQLYTAQTLRASTLLLIRGGALRAAIAESPSFANAMTLRVSSTTYALLENLQLCLQGTSAQRVAHYLSQLVHDSVECCEIQLETSKQNIAAQLNLTPETLSRVLSTFARDGMVRTQGGRGLKLENMALLRRCASGQYQPAPITPIRDAGPPRGAQGPATTPSCSARSQATGGSAPLTTMPAGSRP